MHRAALYSARANTHRCKNRCTWSSLLCLSSRRIHGSATHSTFFPKTFLSSTFHNGVLTSSTNIVGSVRFLYKNEKMKISGKPFFWWILLTFTFFDIKFGLILYLLINGRILIIFQCFQLVFCVFPPSSLFISCIRSRRSCHRLHLILLLILLIYWHFKMIYK